MWTEPRRVGIGLRRFHSLPRTYTPTDMDALVAKADAIKPMGQKRARRASSSRDPSSSKKPSTAAADKTAQTVVAHTRIPASLRAKGKEVDRTGRAYSHVTDKRLRAHLASQSLQNVRAKGLIDDLQDLLVPDEQDNAGLRVEHELERTWRVGQEDIVQAVGGQAASGRREWKLDGGSYRARYTRNGRYVHTHLYHSLAPVLSRWL